MAYPPAYTRTYSFTDWETLHPGEPKPGPQLDAEYDGVSNALTATQTNLALIQRADGALANDSVGEDQLQDGIFDGIADGITADAEAAAAAAQASATAAATSASQASASATSAATSDGNAAGAAAQAGVSQGIAQTAAVDADTSADDAAASAAAAANSANEAQGFRNEAGMHEELAFDWAEKLEGPVMPAPPGWPEAVDDGMFSAKWWAIRARDYMTVTHLDLGSGQANIGDAMAEWLAIPGNEMPLGLVYATWGSPPLEYALTDPTDPTNPDSWTLITGGIGPPGPGNTLTIGTVTTGAVGQPAAATITGVSPDQVLNLTLPTGATGPQGVIGPAGPPNALSIGTVTTVPDGTPSSATITGTAPTQTLNLVLTAGPQGIQGIQGIQGPVGPPVNLGDPTGLIGLAAVNGVATTAPRSDSRHALDQSIAPTWTGFHTFTNANGISITNGDALYELRETDVAADNKVWWMRANSSQFVIQTRTDAAGVGVDLLRASRIGTAIDAIYFGSATGNPTYSFLGTGAMTGAVQATWTGNHIWGSVAGGRFFLIGGAVGVMRSRFDDNGLQPVFTTQNGGITAANQGWGWVNQFAQDGTTFFPAGQFQWKSEGDYGSAATRNSSLRILVAANGVDTEVFNLTSTLLQIAPSVNVNGGTLRVAGPASSAVNSVCANGSFAQLACQVSGVEGLYIINNYSAAAVAGIPPSCTGIGNVSGSPFVFGWAGNECARFTQGGGFQITGTVTGGLRAAQGLELGISGAEAAVLSYNRATGVYTGLLLSGSYVNVRDGFTGGEIRLQNKTAMSLLSGDTYLRLNANSEFTSGVYCPTQIRTSTWLVCEDGVKNAAGTRTVGMNAGLVYYGSAYVTGVSNGYHGLAVYDGGLNPTLMSNNSEFGIYSQADAKWLVERQTTTTAKSDYNVSAPSFTSTSSRAIKRETGTPSKPASILARLRPLLYRLLDGDDREQLGLVAEEVHEVCPQLSDGKTVAYDRLAILLLAAWQDEHATA